MLLTSNLFFLLGDRCKGALQSPASNLLYPKSLCDSLRTRRLGSYILNLNKVHSAFMRAYVGTIKYVKILALPKSKRPPRIKRPHPPPRMFCTLQRVHTSLVQNDPCTNFRIFFQSSHHLYEKTITRPKLDTVILSFLTVKKHQLLQHYCRVITPHRVIFILITSRIFCRSSS
jgi:hypothetical protein